MRRLLLFSLALSAWASEISGHWTDCQEVGHHCQMEQTFNLHAEGEKLTGTVTWRQEESTRGITRKEIVNISDGKISGNEISVTTAYKTKGYLIIPRFWSFPARGPGITATKVCFRTIRSNSLAPSTASVHLFLPDVFVAFHYRGRPRGRSSHSLEVEQN